MSKRRQEILRLKNCLACHYDLTALPRDHQCPECGAKYDSRMFSFPVWRTNDEPSILKVIILGTMTGIGALSLFASVNQGRPGYSSICPLVWTLAFGSGFLLAINQIRLKRAGQTDSRLIMNVSEVQLVCRNQPFRRVGWPQARKIKMKRRGRRWRLRILPRLFSFRGRIDVIFKATKIEAALIRNEIRRRVKEAHQTKSHDARSKSNTIQPA